MFSHLKQTRLPPRGRPIFLITRIITDRIGLHSVLFPLQLIIIIIIIITIIIIIIIIIMMMMMMIIALIRKLPVQLVRGSKILVMKSKT